MALMLKISLRFLLEKERADFTPKPNEDKHRFFVNFKTCLLRKDFAGRYPEQFTWGLKSLLDVWGNPENKRSMSAVLLLLAAKKE